MEPKPMLCTCKKRFKTNNAMLQHQRDSSLHADTNPEPEQMMQLHGLVQRLSLQDQKPDHSIRRADRSKRASSAKCSKFIPFRSNEATTFFARAPDLRISSWSETVAPSTAEEKKVIVADGPKKKKQKKKGTRNIPKMDRSSGGESNWQVSVNTDYMMDLLEEDQNWALCDKDCG